MSKADFQAFPDAAVDFLAHQQIVNEIPGVDAEDPWSSNSLHAAEGIFLDRYSELSSVPKYVLENYETFLGAGLVITFGGSGILLDPALLGPDEPQVPHGVGVYYEASDHVDVVSSLIPQALAVRTGAWWWSIFETTRQVIARAATSKP